MQSFLLNAVDRGTDDQRIFLSPPDPLRTKNHSSAIDLRTIFSAPFVFIRLRTTTLCKPLRCTSLRKTPGYAPPVSNSCLSTNLETRRARPTLGCSHARSPHFCYHA